MQVNDELEYHVPSAFKKPTSESGRSVRERFIKAKYAEKIFLNDGTRQHLSAISDVSVVDDSEGASGCASSYTYACF